MRKNDEHALESTNNFTTRQHLLLRSVLFASDISFTLIEFLWHVYFYLEMCIVYAISQPITHVA